MRGCVASSSWEKVQGFISRGTGMWVRCSGGQVELDKGIGTRMERELMRGR